MSVLRPVVLSGGSGTRLWPLSTTSMPKQFLPLFDGHSLFELTLTRLDGLGDVAPPLVVTGADQVELVETALAATDSVGARVILEPIGRNTAPAVVAAALVSDPADVLVIVPSDHIVSDVRGFGEAVEVAARHAGRGEIVTFGVRPARPATGYGYIEVGESVGDGAFTVAGFKEKPTREVAQVMVDGGGHLWNSGMFVARAGRVIAEAGEHCPAILEGVRAALPEGDVDGRLPLDQVFEEVESISFDYAIMEKTAQAVVVPIDVGWNDVGSYLSLLESVDRDDRGNHVDGEATLIDVERSFVSARSKRVVVCGVSDVVVVETEDTVLVVPLERSQDVGEISKRVESD